MEPTFVATPFAQASSPSSRQIRAWLDEQEAGCTQWQASRKPVEHKFATAKLNSPLQVLPLVARSAAPHTPLWLPDGGAEAKKKLETPSGARSTPPERVSITTDLSSAIETLTLANLMSADPSSDDEPSRKRSARVLAAAAVDARAKRQRPTPAPSRSPSSESRGRRVLRPTSEAPVSVAQLQAQEREIALLKARMLADEKEKTAAAAGLRKGARPPSPASSKRSRARTLRHGRRSPRSPAAADPRLAGVRVGVPLFDLDGDGDAQPEHACSSVDALKAAVLHSTAWRNVRLEAAPPNVLPDVPGLAPPFAAQFDTPLSDYAEDPRALAAKCAVAAAFARPPPLSLTTGSPKETAHRAAVEERVEALVEEATPLIKSAHSARGKTIIANARRQVRAYLATLPQLRAHVEDTAGRSFRPLQISRLEKVATRTILKNLVDHKETNPILYTVGRGESALSERQVFHTRVVVLSKVTGISRSTTCMETRGTVRVEDDPIIRFVPIFSDTSKTDARFDEQFDGFGGGQKGFLSALDDERKELLLRYVVAGCDGSPTVFSVLKEHDHFKQPQTDYVEIYNRCLREKWRAELMAELETIVSGDAADYTEADTLAISRLVEDYHQRSLGVVLRDRLEPPPTYFQLLHLSARRGAPKHNGLALAAAPTDDYETMAGRYRNFFCRRCLTYNCLNHGVNQPIPSTRSDPRYPAVRAALRLQREVEGKIVGLSSADENDAAPPAVKEEVLPDVIDVDTESSPVDKQEDGGGGAAADPTADENDDDGSAIRRSARSLTAASTKASTILVSQRSKEKKKSLFARSYRGPHSDISEYLGQDVVYRSIAMVRRTELLAVDTPCSRECSKLRPPVAANGFKQEGGGGSSEWAAAEVLVLDKLEKCLGALPCVIAAVLKTRSCGAVAAFLRRRQEVEEAEALIGYKANSRDLARPVGARGNSHDHLRRTRMQRMKDRGANHEFVPCNHAGVSCNSGDCGCMRRDHYCEKACGCPADCANRFPGCKCDPGQCRSATCPCYFAGRECDPDACFACGSCEVPVEAYDAVSARKWREQSKLCGNVNILRGLMRKVGVAASSTHGWGAFAREAMRKGDFIYEYTGELLSQDEAERRGNVYDKSTVSFLFDLNEDAVVDATRKGNKSKFANHSAADEKCVAKILRVNGEHRIGVFANAEIAPDEELFFNYGYHGVVPDWTQARVASAKHSGDADNAAAAEAAVETSDVKMEDEDGDGDADVTKEIDADIEHEKGDGEQQEIEQQQQEKQEEEQHGDDHRK